MPESSYPLFALPERTTAGGPIPRPGADVTRGPDQILSLRSPTAGSHLVQVNPLWPVTLRFPPLERDLKVDVAIVGAGIAGISCGYHLSRAGYDVAVIEQDEIGSGASGASSGVLYYGSGLNFAPSSRLFGEERTQLLWKETGKAIEEIARVQDRYAVECGFRRCGSIMVAKTQAELESLESERAGLARCGISSRILGTDEVRSIFPRRAFSGGLTFDACSQVHPALLASGLAKGADLDVYEHSPMTGFDEGAHSVIVKTPNSKITCSTLLLATNHQPAFGLESYFEFESSVILASQSLPHIDSTWLQEKILWSMEEKYDLVYPRGNRAILELYQLGDEKAKLSYYYPGLDFRVEHEWGDVWAKTHDWLPIVGRVTPRVAVAIAMGDQGIIMSWVSAAHITKSLEGERDWFLEMVSPRRFYGSESGRSGATNSHGR